MRRKPKEPKKRKKTPPELGAYPGKLGSPSWDDFGLETVGTPHDVFCLRNN